MSRLINIQTTSPSEKAWAFSSPVGGGADFYVGGFYSFGSTHNDFSPAATHGTANAAYGAHFFLVLGATAVDEITLTVTGTSITDAGVRAAGATQTIVIPDASVADTYFETSKKWIGQVSVVVTTGTPKNCNYGYAKYWDNNNTEFQIEGLEVSWLAGASDATPEIHLHKHSATGWTYNAGAAPTEPTALYSMNTDYNTEIQTVDGEEGAWKRADLSDIVLGAGSEGTIWEIHTSAARTFEIGNIIMRISPR